MKSLCKKGLLALLTTVVMLAALAIQGPVKAEAKNVSSYKQFWSNVNTSGVTGKPTKVTKFKVPEGQKLKLNAISLYHYNNGSGKTPGKITLKRGSTKIGSWTAKGRTNNQWWDVFPDITLSAGTYTITCSSKTTWSCNSTSEFAGFAEVYGEYSGVTRPKKPTITSIEFSSNENGIASYRIDWSKVSKASGYQVQVSARKNFYPALKATRTVNYAYHNKSTSKENDVKQYVRVRAFKKSGSEKIYGAWSTIKSYIFSW